MSSPHALYQTPASRRRLQQLQEQSALPSSSSSSSPSSSSTAVGPSALPAHRSRSNPALLVPNSTYLSLTGWCCPPLDVLSHVCQYLPLSSLLTLGCVSRAYHQLLSHPLSWRTPSLSLSLHHPHHAFLSSLLLSSPHHSLFQRLQQVDISHSLFSATSLLFLSHCASLRTVRVHQSQYDVDTIARILSLLAASSAASLSSLTLSSLRLSDAAVLSIARLPNITTLDLRGSSEFGAVGLSALAALTGLKELNLEGCDGVNDRAVAALLHDEGDAETEEEGREDMRTDSTGAVFPHLMSLRLSSSAITDRSLCLLSLHCRTLTSLNLTGCKSVTMAGLQALSSSLLALSSLGLARCPLVFELAAAASSDSPAFSFPVFPSLTLLTISSVGSSSLSVILSSHRCLTHLAIASPHQLTSSAFPLLLSLCPRLRELGLSLWGRGRRDVLFTKRVREVVRRWGKEVRGGGLVMIGSGCSSEEGRAEVRGMLQEIVQKLETAAAGGGREEKEQDTDGCSEGWVFTQYSRRLRPRLHLWC